ncbi:MAG: VWA domain-containing protein, partial [Cyanobacteria bacterium]|nr:VWA domain-containing protein [Cyanobacteriota bacterium]
NKVDKPTSSVVLYRDGDECYGMVSLLPPSEDTTSSLARDVLFVVDRSGSMMGEKMTSAARACSILLSSLGPCDRFAILAFDHSLEWFDGGKNKGRYIQASEQGVESGIKFLRDLYARGGTELLPAFEQAVELIENDRENERVPVVVLITDGQVGNEGQILSFCQKRLGDTRTFTVGIDTAVNFSFLTRLAKLAGGTSTFVAPGAQLESALIGISREIGVPLVTDLQVYSFNKVVKLSAFAPGRIPDLFAGRTSDCYFKVTCPANITPRLTVKGKLQDGRTFSQTVDVKETKFDAIRRMWTREYIRELEDQYRVKTSKQDAIKQEIIQLSIKHSVLCRFTAFIAIDADESLSHDGKMRQIVQPVHNADLWHKQEQAITGSWGAVPKNIGCASPPGRFSMMQSQSRADDTLLSGTAFGIFPRLQEAAQASDSLSGYCEGRARRPEIEDTGKDGGIFGMFDVWSRMKSVKGSDPSSSIPPTSPLARVESSLESFKKIWSEIWIMLCQGQLPDYKQLDEARSQLMDALADHPVGFEVPLLQKQLRTSVRVLISASKNPDIDVAKLVSLYSGLTPEVERALAETNKAMSKFRGRAGAFWETSV